MQKRLFLSSFKLCLFSSFLLFSSIGQAQCPQLTWSDEFSGTSLDLSNWNYQTGDGCAEGICGWGNNELQSYQQANVEVSGGTLKITAKEERIKSKKYTSGRINTKSNADFTYGRFEALIKLPAGDGLWPAFWMLSTTEPYGGWPQSGEIDIMEFVASNPDEVLGTIHYGDPSPNNQFQGNSVQLSSGVFPDAFHEFAIEWEPGEIRWFLDGVLFSRKNPADLSPYNWPFDHNFHFLLNVAVGGDLGGPVDDNMLPATMEVDYVRVYSGFKPHLSGPRLVENQATGQVYSVENITGTGTVVTWAVPAGATIVSGQGSSSIAVDFGTDGGTISAAFSDSCSMYDLSFDVDMEAPYVKGFSFENFDDPAIATYSFSTGTLTELANPGPDAVNSSALSGKYDRNSSEQYDVLYYDVTNIADATEYVDRRKKFYMDVYTSAPVGTEVLLQLETSNATSINFPTGRHSRFVATTSQQNSWERLVFSLLDQPDLAASPTGIQDLVVLFASNTFTGDTYYFDNLDSYDEDAGSGSNQPPTVSISSPADGSSFTAGNLITISADASDSDGSVSQVEFFSDGSSLGVDNSLPYEISWTVPLGTVTLTAVATDNESAETTSAGVDVTGTSAGSPTSMHVASIVTGTANAGQGSKYGTATVTIVDDLGGLVANASVTGTFSGTFSDQITAATDANGVALLQTVSTAKGGVVVDLCVDQVVHASLSYDSGSNVVTCSNGSSRIAADQGDQLLMVFPNPAEDQVSISSRGFSSALAVKVLDAKGNLLYLNPSLQADTDFILDISAFSRGLYIIHVWDELGNRKAVKLMK